MNQDEVDIYRAKLNWHYNAVKDSFRAVAIRALNQL